MKAMANSASSSQEREAPGVDPVVAALGRRVQDLEERAEHDKAEILMIKAEHIRQMAKYEQPKQKQDKKYRTLICRSEIISRSFSQNFHGI